MLLRGSIAGGLARGMALISYDKACLIVIDDERNIGDDPTADAVPRCRALRFPDSLVEPPFEQFHPF